MWDEGSSWLKKYKKEEKKRGLFSGFNFSSAAQGDLGTNNIFTVLLDLFTTQVTKSQLKN